MAYSAKFKKQMYLSKESGVSRKQYHQVHGFPVRIELLLQGILPAI
jgi:hypothetical protein